MTTTIINDTEIYSNINFCSFWNQDGPTLWMGWAVAAVGRSYMHMHPCLFLITRFFFSFSAQAQIAAKNLRFWGAEPVQVSSSYILQNDKIIFLLKCTLLQYDNHIYTYLPLLKLPFLHRLLAKLLVWRDGTCHK